MCICETLSGQKSAICTSRPELACRLGIFHLTLQVRAQNPVLIVYEWNIILCRPVRKPPGCDTRIAGYERANQRVTKHPPLTSCQWPELMLCTHYPYSRAVLTAREYRILSSYLLTAHEHGRHFWTSVNTAIEIGRRYCY